MPDIAVHAAFGKEVLSSLPQEVRDSICPEPYTFALFGPDLWFMHRPWLRRQGRGRQMHTTRMGAFLLSLLRQARSGPCREEMFSYLAGFLCHYALDSTAHPYVIWVTTEERHFPRSHMSLEHALDAAEIRRAGLWGTAHPITDHYFPLLRLPESMQLPLNTVFEEVYGWKNCRKALNRSCRRFRRLYRILENPRGLASRLTRLTGVPVLRSLCYSESQFLDADAENTRHRTWHHAHDPSLSSTESFPDLREKAQLLAVKMITASWSYVFREEGTEEDLAALIGNHSYLSGFPEEDPRNYSVPSLLPSSCGPSAGGPSC